MLTEIASPAETTRPRESIEDSGAPPPESGVSNMSRVSTMGSVNIGERLRQITEHWSPKTVTTVNDYDVRLVRVCGEFVRHQHIESDEFFLVIEGELTIRMDDRDVTLGAGELFVVPRGAYHQPFSEGETALLLFEPSEMVNTGDAGGPLTAARVTI